MLLAYFRNNLVTVECSVFYIFFFNRESTCTHGTGEGRGEGKRERKRERESLKQAPPEIMTWTEDAGCTEPPTLAFWSLCIPLWCHLSCSTIPYSFWIEIIQSGSFCFLTGEFDLLMLRLLIFKIYFYISLRAFCLHFNSFYHLLYFLKFLPLFSVKHLVFIFIFYGYP